MGPSYFLLSLPSSSTALFAGTIPYPTPGQTATPVTVTANGGDVTAYFVGVSADDDDKIALWDTTAGTITAFSLDNKTSHIGDPVDFGTFAAGHVLVFVLENVTANTQYDSVQGAAGPHSADGQNHAYITPLVGFTLDGYTFPSTGGPLTYVGFEDLVIPNNGTTEPDYNDDQFLFSNVVATPTPLTSQAPEPSTFVLLGTGLIGAAGALRRKLAR